MTVRMATKADEHAVCRLWTMLLHFYRQKRDPALLSRSFHYTLEHPAEVKVFVSLKEEVVTATASLHLGHYSTWNDNWYGHVEDMIVDPAYRGCGFASMLVSHIIEVARSEKLARLELNALNENYPARKMYEKHGFTTDSVAYELKLT